MLGPGFNGVVTCDRWRPYRSCFGSKRQLCWAHLAREATGAQDRAAILAKVNHARLVARGDQLQAWGQQFEAAVDQLFALWHAFRNGTLEREGEGGEPTNNEPERELRGPVIARGLMLSTKSEAGRLLFTRLMSAAATCRKQGRNLLDYLRMALERHARGLSPPSLVSN